MLVIFFLFLLQNEFRNNLKKLTRLKHLQVFQIYKNQKKQIQLLNLVKVNKNKLILSNDILEKIKTMQEKRKKEQNLIITGLPNFESDFELLHKKYYQLEKISLKYFS